jgi:hypothetical protein
MQFESFFIQSNFLSEEILTQIYNAKIEGQKPQDFDLPPKLPSKTKSKPHGLTCSKSGKFLTKP